MTSHYRHRRTSNPAVMFSQLEPGELAVNTANRQVAIGDADTASIGSPLPLLAIRIFDARSRYAGGDFVVYGGAFYRAKVAINFPAAFNPTDWEIYSDDSTIRDYIDGETTGKVSRAGDTMVGPLILAADPVADLEAVTKLYVDSEIAGVTVDYQAADSAIAAAALPLLGGTLTGPLVLAGNPTANLGAATKQYVDAKSVGIAEAPLDNNVFARQNGGWSNISATFAVMVPNTRLVSAAGLATGGGALDVDRTITVTAASQAEAQAGTDNTKAMTPARTKDAIDALQLIKQIASQTEAQTGTNNTKGMTPLRVAQAIATKVQEAITAFATGDVKFSIATVAMEGWLLMNDGTIGDASSGASARANDDCQALFALLWTNINQTYAPVTGGRGASADADWTAHKPIALLKVLGRALAGAGSGAGLTPHALGMTLGEETHVLTAAEVQGHDHPLKTIDAGQKPPWDQNPMDGLNAPAIGSKDDAGNRTFVSLGSNPTVFDLTGPIAVSRGASAAHNVMQPTTFLNVMIKL